MECSNCGFQNLPELDACGRCGASLRLATAEIDVHPPRASAAVKQWRRTSTYRLLNPVIETVAERRPDLSQAAAEIPHWKEILRSLIPGLPQWAAGQRSWSRILAGAYIGLLVFSLLNFGTAFGNFLIGLLLTCHGASVWDAAAQTPSPLARSVRMLCFAGACALAIYGPPYWLMSTVAQPMAIRLPRVPFQQGDVLLVNRRAFLRRPPQTGDVVLYTVPRNTIVSINPARTNVRIAVAGQRIDRVLASAGQQVEMRDGVLLVDGSPSSTRSLNLLPLPAEFAVRVPPRYCLVLPSADLLTAGAPADQIASLGMVPWESVEGRVYWQIHPVLRSGVIR